MEGGQKTKMMMIHMDLENCLKEKDSEIEVLELDSKEVDEVINKWKK